MELDLAGVDQLLNPLSISDPTKKSKGGVLDLSGIEEILLPEDDKNKTREKSSTSSTIKFQPDLTDWDISKFTSVKEFFKKEFDKDIPARVGQGSIHNKFSYDHRGSADIGVHPNSPEGKRLMEYLRENNIPFLAFQGRIEGVSTGPHIHIGKPSKKIADKIPLGTTEQSEITELNLSGIDEVLEEPKQLNLTDVEEVDRKEDAIIVDPFDVGFKKATPKDLSWEVKAAIGAGQDAIPKVLGRNPDEPGDIVKTKISWNYATGDSKSRRLKKPDVNTITDAWLEAWNPEYAFLNQQYRKETGGLNLALVDSPRNIKYIGNGEYEIKARTARGVQALFEAYKKGGVSAVVATNNIINQQRELFALQAEADIKAINEYKKTHPYASAVAAGLQSEVQQTAILANNLKYLGKAMWTAATKGWESKEYLDLVNQEIEEKEQIFAAQENVYQPEDISGKITKGITSGVAMIPRLQLAATAKINLPTLVYLENMHMGNREAALSALPMAIMVGGMQGATKFFGGTSGTSAPLRRVTQKDLSLFQDSIKNVEPLTVKNLSPIERQLVLRGFNALTQATDLVFHPDQSLEDFTTNIVVGLTFPVGKGPREVRFPTPETRLDVRVPFQIGERKIEVPLTSRPTPILEQSRGIDSTDPLIASLEKGFEARGQAETINLSLDTANLNLIDLKRSLEQGTYRAKGDSLQTGLQKQAAIQKAIEVLEQAIPEETKQFFQENEQAIRTALRSNYELSKQKADFLQKREENLRPDNIKQAFSETLPPDMESHRKLSTETKNKYLNNLFKVESNKLGGSVFGLDILARKSADAAYIGAWYVEDFYLRGIKPTVEMVRNRLKTQFEGITDDVAKFIFDEGNKYYQSNLADPFFSRMKQDAMEKLPNKLTRQQAVDILSQHKDEFEWTTGLKEFLNENVDKKINKKDLIDIIQRGQVRVEESVGIERQEITEGQQEINRKLSMLHTDRNLLGVSEWKEARDIDRQIRELHDESKRLGELPTTKFSLTAYLGEKLELAGAKNSKEVKLITPLEVQQQAGITFRQIQDYAISLLEKDYPDINISDPVKALQMTHYARAAEFFGLKDNVYPENVRLEDYDKPVIAKVGPVYKSPHWDEPNVVAHYRSNDRVTTDNQRVYFGEEFQSDWNHDIREQGTKLSTWEATKLQEEKQQLISENNKLVGVKDYGDRLYEIGDRVQQIDELLRGKIEPNPFMQHNWKELVMKRFLRDAAIAKDDNGNYKYDGIGWTTARQQQERYGGVLEGKEFNWTKNSDGTYTFGLKRTGQAEESFETYQYPHELERISLERFAELTTPEAAQEVRDQEAKRETYFGVYTNVGGVRGEFKTRAEAEKILRHGDRVVEEFRTSGQFSLKEAVELRSGIGKYSDYDVAYKNIVSKIGKRFGAKYSEKEIKVPYTIEYDIPSEAEARRVFTRGSENKIRNEKIHYLEITPSMRQSLEKEGLPLFGTGGSEPLKNPEIGIRNRITNAEAFNQHRENLVKELNKLVTKELPTEAEARLNQQEAIATSLELQDLEAMRTMIEAKMGDVFDSGLNADAFVDQTKQLYKDVKTFEEFSEQMISTYGERIKSYLQDLWIQVKNLGNDYKSSFNLMVSDFKNAKESPAYKFRKGERGAFGRQKTLAEEEYIKSRDKVPYYEWYSLWRGVGLTQLSTEAGLVMDNMRQGQRIKNSFENSVLQILRKANKLVKGGLDQAVADNIWMGNENSRTWTVAELAAGDPTTSRPALNAKQIDAYLQIRKAVDLNLDHRRDTKLYSLRERAIRLSNQLATKTAGTPEYDAIATKLLDLADNISKVNDHYTDLKKSGYISTKRMGKLSAYTEDSSGPIYQQFDSIKEAGIWLKAQEDAGANAAVSKIYDVRKPENLKTVAAKLTPAQFEDLVDAAGVNSHTPEIEKLRDEVYSRFPSFGYELKRDFVRGYERNWKFMQESISQQTQIYANSRYSRVSGNEAVKELNRLNVQDSDYKLYQTLQKYIDHEISAPEITGASQAFGFARKGVYLFHLGFDINQLWLNALAQPMTQTYSYFSRVSHNGIRLKGLEPEKYFVRAWKLSSQVAKDTLTGSKTVDPNFEAIRQRLIAEDVIGAEFNKSLLELETEKTVSSNLQRLSKKSIGQHYEHWAGTFMRAGEKTTRTHVAAEAYLVGKEKFSLSGEDLVNFIVRAVDATQTNPSRAEAPLAIRGSQNQGEIRKLAYQFNAFNHMWIENLALNVRADFQNRRLNATSRHLAPLVLMGGIAGLPLAGFAGTLYRLITGEDPRKYFDDIFGKDSFLEGLALYGFTGHATLGQKTVPSIPVLDQIKLGDSVGESLQETFSLSSIPAFATAGQITKGLEDIAFEGDIARGIGTAFPNKIVRNIATAERFREEGVKTRGGKTIVPRNEVTPGMLFGQTLGITPSEATEYYERQKSKQLIKIHKKSIKPLKKRLKRIL